MVHVGICPCVYGRGKPSVEFYKDGKSQIYCYGWGHDKDDFEEELTDSLADSGDYDDISDEEFDKIVAEKLKEYEPYWKKVIYIRASI